MQLVERHVIRKTDSRYQAIDAAAFASKNLYNLANYHMRQSYIHTGTYLGYAAVYHLVKGSDAYTALPRKVSNDVLRLLDKNWKAFRNALAAKVGFLPRLVNGRPLKSTNQYYNKRKAALQQKLGTTGTTNRMERMTASSTLSNSRMRALWTCSLTRRNWWVSKSSCKKRAIPAKRVFWIVTRSRPMARCSKSPSSVADG